MQIQQPPRTDNPELDVWLERLAHQLSMTWAEWLAKMSGEAAAAFDMNTQKIVGVVDPTTDQDAATKKYVDDQIRAGFLPSDEHLVGYWAFDDGSGTVAVDGSGNGLNGTLVGTPAWVAGVVGTGLDFDGTNDYVTISHDAAFNFPNDEFTISVWINKAWVDTNNHIVSHLDGALDGWYIAVQYHGGADKDYVAFRTNDNVEILAFEHGLSDDEWGLVTFTWDGTTLTGYINAVEKGSAGLASVQSADTPLYFGVWSVGSARYDGKMDEVRIYSTALTTSEIKALYDYPGGK